MTGAATPPPNAVPAPVIPDDAYRRLTLQLRLGLVISLAILMAALVAYLLAHPSESSTSAIGSNPILQYLSLSGFSQGLASGAPEAYLALGLFVLIATPIARVAAGAYYFRRGRERVMTWVTVTVLVLLLFGVLILGPLVH